MNNNRKNLNTYFVVIFVLLFLAAWMFRNLNGQETDYTKGELREALESGKVLEAVIQPNKETPTGAVRVALSNGEERILYVTDVKEVEAEFASFGIDPEIRDIPRENWFMTSVFPMLLVLVIGVFFFVMMNSQNAGGGSSGKMMNFGKSRAKLSLDNKTTLSDVAGLQEEKEELDEIISFLKSPGKFTKVGARIPKGVLLEGAPGTGKTLLAKAIAGEANVPFFSISGSEFGEMFVGVGASRVRELFANEGIIVLAATNRVDILDPAILRPGRFDRKITVSPPDVRGRKEILTVHSKNKPLAEDVNLEQIAQTTAGFTGADLENLMNEAAIHAAMSDRAFVKQEDIKKSFIKVGIGTEKKSRIISDKEKKITAYHEAGHAILFHVLPDVGPVYTVSIIPTGLGAAGYTMPLPEKDEMFMTKGKMLQEIMVSLGGRIAEEIIFDDITTGASSDIKKATKVARRMVTRYGMSDNIGVINYDDDDDEVFIGRDLAHAKSHSELVSGEIDREVKEIIDGCYAKAKAIITDREDVLHKCAELLLEKEKITREEFEALMEDKPYEPEDFFKKS